MASLRSSGWQSQRRPNQETTQHNFSDRESEGSIRSERDDKANDIYVGNIPASFDETDLLGVFRGYRVISVRNFTKQDKKVFAFLKCVDQAEVLRIVSEMDRHQVDGRQLKLRPIDPDLQEKINKMPTTGHGDQRDNIRHRSFKSRDGPLPLIPRNYDDPNGSKTRFQTKENLQPQDRYIHSNRDHPPPLELDDSRPPPLERYSRNVSSPAPSQTRTVETRSYHAPSYRPAEHRPIPGESYHRPRTTPADGYNRSAASPVDTYRRPSPGRSSEHTVNAYCRPVPHDGYDKSPVPPVNAYRRPQPVESFHRSLASPFDAHRRHLPNKYIEYRVPPKGKYREPAAYEDTEFQDGEYLGSTTLQTDRHYEAGHVGALFKSSTPRLATPVRVSPVPQNIYICTTPEDPLDETVVVCVANFPYRTTEDDLFALFEDFSPLDVDIVENFPTDSKEDFTYALVTLPNLELAEAAIFELDNTTFHRRVIIVQLLCGDDISFEERNHPSSSITGIGLTRTASPKKYSLQDRQTLCERFSHLKMASGARLFH